MNWRIAIDGPAGAGKSTISKKLAKILGFEYIDTGAMYRAVTLKALNLQINLYQEEEYKFLEETKIDFRNQFLFLDDKDVSEEIRSLDVSNNVSLVSSFGYVRKKMVQLQRELSTDQNVIMDGRDIGTVVMPDADLKIFLNADIKERAKRRMNERLENNQVVLSLEETIDEIQKRDEKDSSRPISPLLQAKDAVLVDTSNLKVDEVVEEIINLVLKRGYKMENLEKKETVLKKKTATEKVVKEETAKDLVDEKVAETTGITEETVEDPKVKKTRKKAVEAPVEEMVAEETVEEPKVKKTRKKAVEAPVEEMAAEETVEEPKVKKTRKKAVEAQVEEKLVEEAVEAPAEEKLAEEAVEVPVEEKLVEEAVETQVEEKGEEDTVEGTKEEVEEEVEEEDLEDDDESSEAEAPETEEESEEEKPDKPKYRELQVVEGTVIEVIEERPEERRGNRTFKSKPERVLIQLDDGQEGFLFRKDTADIEENEDLFDLFLEGDRVQVVIKKIYPDGGKLIFSTLLLKMRNELKKFNEIIKNHETIIAKVVKQLNVGYLLKHDVFSCLLPSSQVAVAEEEREALIGAEIEVAPIRIDYGRIRLIVSQTVANAIKKRQEKRAFLETVEIGQVFDGVVKNIESYGAFVEIADGVEGLLHISELDHNRVYKVEKVVNIGDELKVQVIKVNNDHVGLSRKALLPNRWTDYVVDKEVGAVVEGKIIEINNSGLVMQLADEVTGFLPKSEFAYERNVYITDYVNVEETISTKIIEIDPHKKRIILSRKQLSENPWEKLKCKINDSVEVTVTKELKDGYKVSLDGAIGYLPKRSISFSYGPVAEGDVLKVKVRVFDPLRTRLVVNMRAEFERQERETYGKFMKSQDKLSNTFGDLLEDQLKGFKKK